MTVDDLLEGFKSPLLLLWGNLDPWIRPTAADKIQVNCGRDSLAVAHWTMSVRRPGSRSTAKRAVEYGSRLMMMLGGTLA